MTKLRTCGVCSLIRTPAPSDEPARLHQELTVRPYGVGVVSHANHVGRRGKGIQR